MGRRTKRQARRPAMFNIYFSSFRDRSLFMKHLIFIISSVLFLCATHSYAQVDSIQYLKEVVFMDTTLKEYSEGYKLTTITDTLIKRNSASLTDVLRYNSTIYFKENGYGMVASPSFRGTNASQTAVIWNGIAINSNLTGQTDFNTISINAFNSIIIRSGGGSTQYGSGAVGGSVHLNNSISFTDQKIQVLRLLYGSFSTWEGTIKTTHSNEKRYFDLGIDFISSENDFTYLGKNKKNENGAFLRFNTSLNGGLKFKKSILSWNSNYFFGNRNFSRTLTTPAKDSYNDITFRNLLSWKTNTAKLNSTLKGAHLFENYRYFPNKDKSLFFNGKTNTFITDYLMEYHALLNLKVSGLVNYTFINAEGSSIGKNNRNTLSTVLLLYYQLTDRFSYGVNMRQEFLNDFDNPFLVSLDGKYLISPLYSIKFNASKNYRIPTFNDLYWDKGGNKDLMPETSYQVEIGNEFSWREIQLNINGFFITSENLIKWQPNGESQFSPINIQETENIGFEVSGNFFKNFNDNHFSFNINYAFTLATDTKKNTQLLYVPFHKGTGTINYSFKNISAYYQIIYNGEVFITTDNLGIVADYSVSNIGVEIELNQYSSPIKLGIKANNIFNIYYENVAFRPMPNRNYQLFLTFKF